MVCSLQGGSKPGEGPSAVCFSFMQKLYRVCPKNSTRHIQESLLRKANDFPQPKVRCWLPAGVYPPLLAAALAERSRRAWSDGASLLGWGCCMAQVGTCPLIWFWLFFFLNLLDIFSKPEAVCMCIAA